MSEYELHDLTASYLQVVAEFFGNYSTHVTIYLTLIFGFCVVAFAAGQKLTKFQVILVSLMFVTAAELQAILMYGWVSRGFELAAQLRSINPELSPERTYISAVKAVGVTLWQLGIIASLSFMWSVRHPKVK